MSSFLWEWVGITKHDTCFSSSPIGFFLPYLLSPATLYIRQNTDTTPDTTGRMNQYPANYCFIWIATIHCYWYLLIVINKLHSEKIISLNPPFSLHFFLKNHWNLQFWKGKKPEKDTCTFQNIYPFSKTQISAFQVFSPKKEGWTLNKESAELVVGGQILFSVPAVQD